MLTILNLSTHVHSILFIYLGLLHILLLILVEGFQHIGLVHIFGKFTSNYLNFGTFANGTFRKKNLGIELLIASV